mgnify:CR=1 FL=1
MKNRVVITGLGVVAPNGVGLQAFTNAIKSGKSGITYHQNLKDKGFSCCIGGIPEVSEEKKQEYFKGYCETNKEKLNEQRKQYREANEEK